MSYPRGGGGGGTIASTTNVLKGDGAGAAVDSGLVASKIVVANEVTVANVSAVWTDGKPICRRTAAVTAERTETLPAASSFPAGAVITYIDKVTSTTSAFGTTFAAAGTDTVNGGATHRPFSGPGAVAYESNGVDAWVSLHDQAYTLLFQDPTDPSKQGDVNVAGVTTATKRTMIWPDVANWNPAVNDITLVHKALNHEIGHATDSTLSRILAGILGVEGTPIVIPYYIRLVAAYTLVSQTAVQKLFDSVTNGTLTLVANGTYRFKCKFTLTGMSASSGTFGFALGGTANLTGIEWHANSAKAAAGTSTNTGVILRNQTAANAALTAANTVTSGFTEIEGVFRMTTAGTIIPQVSLSVAAAAVVAADAWFECWQIGTNTDVSKGNWS